MGQANVFYDSSNVPTFDNFAEDINQLRESEVITKNTVMFRVEIGGYGFTKEVSSGTVADSDGIDPTLLSTSKKLIDKRFIKPITELDGRLRKLVYSMGERPSFLAKGHVLLSVNMVRYAKSEIQRFIAEREELVNHLIANYEMAKLDAKRRSPLLYRESDYPTADQLRSKFKVKYEFTTVPSVDILERIDMDLFEEHHKERQAQMEEALQEYRTGLRAGLAELTTNLLDKVRGIGTERKQFKDGFVNNMKEFLEFFDAKNITNDTELAEQVRVIRNLLDGISPDDIRNDFSIKVKVQRELTKVNESLDSMLVNMVREIDV